MTILTLLLVVAAIGAVLQRDGMMARLFGQGPAKLELRRDEVVVRANVLSFIDVLANDVGLRADDLDRLLIVKQPPCGRVFLRESQISYLPAERCAGPQTFKYGISGRPGHFGEVVALVRLGDPAQSEITAEARRDVSAPVPLAPRVAIERNADDPSALPAQPETGGSGAADGVLSVPSVPRPQAGTAGGLAGNGAETGTASTSFGQGLSTARTETGITPSTLALGSGSDPGTADGVGLAVMPRDPIETGYGAVPSPEPPVPAMSTLVFPTPDNPAPSAVAATATLALAVIDAPLTGPGVDDAIVIQLRSEDLVDEAVRAAPRSPDEAASSPAAPVSPVDALASLRVMDASGGLVAVDTTSPPTLIQPGFAQPPIEGTTGVGQPTSGQPATGQDRFAAVVPPAADCVIPASLILEIRPAGQTEVFVDAPCDPGAVAELSYDTLIFGIALDGAGTGSVTVPGLQPSSDAQLRFARSDTLTFNLPFADTERMDRVALIWEAPIRLDLHAFEFGALPGSDRHVRPDNPRSFAEVRRGGGGYLLDYGPVGGPAGVGQHIALYSFWRRNSGKTGVVKLKLDFASRSLESMRAACGAGALAQPDFRVLRSVTGQVSPPELGRLTALGCTAAASSNDRLIGDAVDDMVVLRQ